MPLLLPPLPPPLSLQSIPPRSIPLRCMPLRSIPLRCIPLRSPPRSIPPLCLVTTNTTNITPIAPPPAVLPPTYTITTTCALCLSDAPVLHHVIVYHPASSLSPPSPM